jgi:hypothetical protein
MRAWAYSARGPPRKVLRLQSVPMPRAPREGEVLVRVSHATLTPAMADVMATIPAFLRWWRPVIPEIDFAGEVAAAGPRAPPNVAAPGTRVFSTVSALQSVVGGQGSLAEYVLVDARAAVVHPAPRNIPLEASAGLGGNGQTARVMLRTGGVKAGQRVFVNGGSTGIGIMLLQMLRDAGVYVVATGSDDKEVLVKSLGTDEVRRFMNPYGQSLTSTTGYRLSQARAARLVSYYDVRVRAVRCLLRHHWRLLPVPTQSRVHKTDVYLRQRWRHERAWRQHTLFVTCDVAGGSRGYATQVCVPKHRLRARHSPRAGSARRRGQAEGTG